MSAQRTHGTDPSTWGPLPHEDARNTRNGRHTYSIASVIDMLSSSIRSDGKPPGSIPSGLAGEVHFELARRYGLAPRGTLVPPTGIWPIAERRALDTTAGVGAIPTILTGGLVDALRSRMVLASLGSPVLNFSGDARGKVSVARIATANAVSWVAENAAPSDTAPTWDAVTFTPKTIQALTFATRRLLKSGDAEVENHLLADMASGMAVEIDRVGIAGSGASNQPKGLLNAVGLPTIALGTNGAALKRSDLVKLEKLVGNANGDASAASSPGWVASPDVRAALRLTDNATASGRYAWSDDDKILGRPAWATTSIGNTTVKGSGTGLSGIVYGAFDQLAVNLFGPPDLLVDPYKQSSDGSVHMSMFLDVDVQVFKIAAFAACLDVVTTLS